MHSPNREAKETAMRSQKQQHFEAELDYLHQGLSQPRRTKNHLKVLEKIGRLKKKYKKIQRFYDIDITTIDTPNTKGGKTATAVTYQQNALAQQADSHLGSYLLSSSRQDMSEEALVRLYWQLTEIEATFRSVKTELGMRPVFHQKDRRIKAHIGLSILAYYCVHTLRSQLKIHAYHESWSSLRKRIGHRVRLTTVYPNNQN